MNGWIQPLIFMDKALEMNTPDSSPETIPQACAIPFRRYDGHVEFCLVTSLKKKRWIFPKGIVDPGETLQQTALKEALEEAGLRGEIVGTPLGTYQDSKWGAELSVTVLLMEVTACDDNWHEAAVRKRRWVKPVLVSELVSKKVLKKFAGLAVRRITASSGTSEK